MPRFIKWLLILNPLSLLLSPFLVWGLLSRRYSVHVVDWHTCDNDFPEAILYPWEDWGPR